jgi:hypothetical protein
MRAIAQGEAPAGGAPRALLALEAMEALASLLAITAEPQAERSRRLAPARTIEPVALLAAARTLRFYLPIEPGTTFEVEVTLIPEEGELVVAQCEARRPDGDRAARGELRFLLVPGAGEHAREARARDALRASLGKPAPPPAERGEAGRGAKGEARGPGS